MAEIRRGDDAVTVRITSSLSSDKHSRVWVIFRANLLTLNEVQATDIRIDALKVSFKEVQACLNLHAVAQRRKRNKAHPIHRLSPELFLKILSFALQPTSSLFIVVKAGARDESNLGVAHCLKNSAFKVRNAFMSRIVQGGLTQCMLYRI